jgi:hypothetical protein
LHVVAGDGSQDVASAARLKKCELAVDNTRAGREGEEMLARALAMVALVLLPAGRAPAADADPVTLLPAAGYTPHLPRLGDPAARLA